MLKRKALSAAFSLAIAAPAPTATIGRQETAAPSAPNSHRMPMMRKLSYACDGNEKVTVFLRERNARVSFQGRTYALKEVQAASGTKYSDGSIVWWSKGEEGFLEDQSQGKPVRLAEHCKLEKSPAGAASAVVTGTVAYRERMAMPENALLTIQLQDVSLADAPAEVIAEQKITFAGHQVPLSFELPYDPRKIDAKHSYALSARITVGDQLLFLNTTAARVITQGNPVKVDLALQMVQGQSKGPR